MQDREKPMAMAVDLSSFEVNRIQNPWILSGKPSGQMATGIMIYCLFEQTKGEKLELVYFSWAKLLGWFHFSLGCFPAFSISRVRPGSVWRHAARSERHGRYYRRFLVQARAVAKDEGASQVVGGVGPS